MQTLPPALRRRDDLQAIRDDLEPSRGTTVEERSRILSALCRFAAEQVRARPDGQRILDFQEPRSPASQDLWRRLVAAARQT